MTFRAAGRYGLLHYGDDRAAALAFTAYTAYLHHADVSLRFGCGSLMLDGFHGDERGGFYLYKDVSSFCTHGHQVQSVWMLACLSAAGQCYAATLKKRDCAARPLRSSPETQRPCWHYWCRFHLQIEDSFRPNANRLTSSRHNLTGYTSACFVLILPCSMPKLKCGC